MQKKYGKDEMKYFRNSENIGCPSNWDVGFELYKTKFLVILHQDDKLRENTLEKQHSFLLNRNDIAIVGGLEDGIDSEGGITKTNRPRGNRIFLMAIY